MGHCVKVPPPPSYVLCVLGYLRISFQDSFKRGIFRYSESHWLQVVMGFGSMLLTYLIDVYVEGSGRGDGRR